MRLPQRVRHELVMHAVDEAPREACGLVLLDYQRDEAVHFFPLENVAEEPERSFRLASVDVAWWRVLETRTKCELALFHSHPAAAAHPSHEDLRYGHEGQRLLVLGLAGASPELRAFVLRRHDDDRLRMRLRAVELPLEGIR